jgi:hypothetical protein
MMNGKGFESKRSWANWGTLLSVVGVPAEIRTKHLSNMNLECYHYIILFDCSTSKHTKTLHSAHTVYLCVAYGSHNKQRLFPQTALTGWAL